jgi:hypothetical protein
MTRTLVRSPLVLTALVGLAALALAGLVALVLAA